MNHGTYGSIWHIDIAMHVYTNEYAIYIYVYIYIYTHTFTYVYVFINMFLRVCT